MVTQTSSALSLEFCKEIHWRHIFYTLLRFCTSYISISNERKWLYTKKSKNQMIFSRNYFKYRLSRWSSVNIPTLVKSLLHSLEQVLESIGLFVNTNKTELVCFKQGGATSSLVDKFIYLSSNILFTESDVNLNQAKVWTAVNRIIDCMEAWFTW